MDKESQIPSIISLERDREIQKHKERLMYESQKTKQYKYSMIYEVVKKRCIEKIRHANRTSTVKSIICDIPLVSNDPLYDIQECVKYIQKSFSTHGYKVEFITPNFIVIDWSKPSLPQFQDSRLQDKLFEHTKELLGKYPDIHKVEYVTVDESTFKKSKSKR